MQCSGGGSLHRESPPYYLGNIMGQYIIRRLLQAIPMLFLISIILFALVNIAPGGPMSAYSRSNRIPEEKKEAIKEIDANEEGGTNK